VPAQPASGSAGCGERRRHHDDEVAAWPGKATTAQARSLFYGSLLTGILGIKKFKRNSICLNFAAKTSEDLVLKCQRMHAGGGGQAGRQASPREESSRRSRRSAAHPARRRPGGGLLLPRSLKRSHREILNHAVLDRAGLVPKEHNHDWTCLFGLQCRAGESCFVICIKCAGIQDGPAFFIFKRERRIAGSSLLRGYGG
jgi:hypothetical protein